LAQEAAVVQWHQDDDLYDQDELRGGMVNGPVAETAVRTGHGVAIWDNGGPYHGEWRDGKKAGQGIQVDTDGSRYDGEWRDGLPNGLGMMVLSKESTYIGVWVNGCYRNGNETAWFSVDRSSCR
jgi:hypothetical protein